MTENRPKVKFITLGCKVNQYESEAMLELMLKSGFTGCAQNETADVIVLNSCTVTAEGDRKARQTLRREKSKNPGAIAVLCGCFPQAFPKQAEGLSEADVVLGTANRLSICEKINEFYRTGERVVAITPHQTGEPFEAMSVSEFHGRTRAFLKIEDGCNRFCSYCIIPYARGRVRSKPIEDIKAELEALSEKGYLEAVLTGINLPAYGRELGLTLCDAVEAACSVEKIKRVRLGSLEPEMLTPEVIERLARQEKLCPQFHLSLQSGCEATLKRMNRLYKPEEYYEIVENLRDAFKNSSVTTDVMVGFAGETDEEFRESLEFVKKVKFARIHVFSYSRRPGTAAYNAPDQIENKIKEMRSREMISAGKISQQEFFDSQVGLCEEVLFEQPSDKNVWEGYTKNYTPVRAASALPLNGKIKRVNILSCTNEFCIGRIEQ